MKTIYFHLTPVRPSENFTISADVDDSFDIVALAIGLNSQQFYAIGRAIVPTESILYVELKDN